MVQIRNIPKLLRKKGIGSELPGVCKEYDVVFMGIFGSFVRGEHKKGSDIDIAIRFRKNAGKTLFDLVELQQQLTELFGRKVDLGEIDYINRYIIDDVKKQMKVIYEEGRSR
jgi:predicted nucleotidyltransferase